MKRIREQKLAKLGIAASYVVSSYFMPLGSILTVSAETLEEYQQPYYPLAEAEDQLRSDLPFEEEVLTHEAEEVSADLETAADDEEEVLEEAADTSADETETEAEEIDTDADEASEEEITVEEETSTEDDVLEETPGEDEILDENPAEDGTLPDDGYLAPEKPEDGLEGEVEGTVNEEPVQTLSQVYVSTWEEFVHYWNTSPSGTAINLRDNITMEATPALSSRTGSIAINGGSQRFALNGVSLPLQGSGGTLDLRNLAWNEGTGVNSPGNWTINIHNVNGALERLVNAPTSTANLSGNIELVTTEPNFTIGTLNIGSSGWTIFRGQNIVVNNRLNVINGMMDIQGNITGTWTRIDVETDGELSIHLPDGAALNAVGQDGRHIRSVGNFDLQGYNPTGLIQMRASTIELSNGFDLRNNFQGTTALTGVVFYTLGGAGNLDFIVHSDEWSLWRSSNLSDEPDWSAHTSVNLSGNNNIPGAQITRLQIGRISSLYRPVGRMEWMGPSMVYFGTHSIINQDRFLPIHSMTGQLNVDDFRADGIDTFDWEIRVSSSGLFNAGQQLPVWYVLDGDAFDLQSEVSIYNTITTERRRSHNLSDSWTRFHELSEWDGDSSNAAISMSRNEWVDPATDLSRLSGLFLEAPAGSTRAGQYEGTITWTLGFFYPGDEGGTP